MSADNCDSHPYCAAKPAQAFGKMASPKAKIALMILFHASWHAFFTKMLDGDLAISAIGFDGGQSIIKSF